MSSHRKSESRVVPGASLPSARRHFQRPEFFPPFPSAVLSPDIWNVLDSGLTSHHLFFIRFGKEISFCASKKNPQNPQIFPTNLGR